MKYLALFLPSFVTNSLYMLQNTEYEPREYLQWLWRAPNLRNVRLHKSIKWTTKARLLAIILVNLMLIGFGLGVICIVRAVTGANFNLGRLLVGLGVVTLTPMMAASLLVVPLAIGTAIVQKPKERRLYKQAKQHFADFSGPTIAIAGSYGKTSFRHVLVHIIGAGKTVATPQNNYNTPLGLSLFAHTLKPEHEVAVVELGEYVPGDVAYLSELTQPDIAVITGINRQHMMRMKTKERTVKTVMEVADYVKPEALYINTEGDWAREAATKKQIRFNQDRVGDWKISDIKVGIKGSSFTLTNGKIKLELQTELLGQHQIAPIAASAVIAQSLGVTPKQIQKGVSELKAFERRFEPRQHAGGVLVIDDTYNGNPSGFEVGMDFLDSLEHDGRKVYATPGIIELGDEAIVVHQELGARLAKKDIDHIIFFDTPLSKIMHAAYTAANGKAEVTVMDDMLVFLENIEQFTKPGDVVLMQNSQREDYFYLH